MPYAEREQRNSYQREWLATRRRKWLDENDPCAHCGTSKKLEVDHVDPKKKISHNVWSWSEKRRAEELAKCQVLCTACHKKKSAAAYPPIEHGTNSAYVNLKCRCLACKQAHRVANARYR